MAIRLVPENHRQSFNKVSTHPLQSWEWGEFRKKSGNEVIRLGSYKNNKLESSIQLLLHKIPFTDFKIGTLIKGLQPNSEFLDYLKKLAKKERLLFIKMEPNAVINNKAKKESVTKLLKNYSCVPGRTLFTPTTFWIDLTPTEDSLLNSFHPKTRYNIKVAQKKGVRVIEDNSDEAFERYLDLTGETVIRQGFYAHTKQYHRLMWQHLHKDPVSNHQQPIAHLLTARYNQQIITAWVVFVWHDFLYYPYGASTDKYKNVMANNLMMWEAIRFGKKHGLKTFDLWGREEGKGFTKFKEGYNPKVVEFIGTWDMVTSLLYPVYRKVESLRWRLLRLRTKSGLIKPEF